MWPIVRRDSQRSCPDLTKSRRGWLLARRSAAVDLDFGLAVGGRIQGNARGGSGAGVHSGVLAVELQDQASIAIGNQG